MITEDRLSIPSPASLSCGLCDQICKRASKLECCGAQCCWGCGIRFITKSRKCWACPNIAAGTGDLVQYLKLRETIKNYNLGSKEVLGTGNGNTPTKRLDTDDLDISENPSSYGVTKSSDSKTEDNISTIESPCKQQLFGLFGCDEDLVLKTDSDLNPKDSRVKNQDQCPNTVVKNKFRITNLATIKSNSNEVKETGRNNVVSVVQIKSRKEEIKEETIFESENSKQCQLDCITSKEKVTQHNEDADENGLNIKSLKSEYRTKKESMKAVETSGNPIKINDSSDVLDKPVIGIINDTSLQISGRDSRRSDHSNEEKILTKVSLTDNEVGDSDISSALDFNGKLTDSSSQSKFIKISLKDKFNNLSKKVNVSNNVEPVSDLESYSAVTVMFDKNSDFKVEKVLCMDKETVQASGEELNDNSSSKSKEIVSDSEKFIKEKERIASLLEAQTFNKCSSNDKTKEKPLETVPIKNALEFLQVGLKLSKISQSLGYENTKDEGDSANIQFKPLTLKRSRSRHADKLKLGVLSSSGTKRSKSKEHTVNIHNETNSKVNRVDASSKYSRESSSSKSVRSDLYEASKLKEQKDSTNSRNKKSDSSSSKSLSSDYSSRSRFSDSSSKSRHSETNSRSSRYSDSNYRMKNSSQSSSRRSRSRSIDPDTRHSKQDSGRKPRSRSRERKNSNSDSKIAHRDLKKESVDVRKKSPALKKINRKTIVQGSVVSQYLDDLANKVKPDVKEEFIEENERSSSIEKYIPSQQNYPNPKFQSFQLNDIRKRLGGTDDPNSIMDNSAFEQSKKFKPDKPRTEVDMRTRIASRAAERLARQREKADLEAEVQVLSYSANLSMPKSDPDYERVVRKVDNDTSKDKKAKKKVTTTKIDLEEELKKVNSKVQTIKLTNELERVNSKAEVLKKSIKCHGNTEESDVEVGSELEVTNIKVEAETGKESFTRNVEANESDENSAIEHHKLTFSKKLRNRSSEEFEAKEKFKPINVELNPTKSKTVAEFLAEKRTVKLLDSPMSVLSKSMSDSEDLSKISEYDAVEDAGLREEIEEGEIVESLKTKSKKKKKGKKRKRRGRSSSKMSRRSSIELIKEELDRVTTQVEDIKHSQNVAILGSEKRTVNMIDSPLETTLDSTQESLGDLARDVEEMEKEVQDIESNEENLNIKKKLKEARKSKKKSKKKNDEEIDPKIAQKIIGRIISNDLGQISEDFRNAVKKEVFDTENQIKSIKEVLKKKSTKLHKGDKTKKKKRKSKSTERAESIKKIKIEENDTTFDNSFQSNQLEEDAQSLDISFNFENKSRSSSKSGRSRSKSKKKKAHGPESSDDQSTVNSERETSGRKKHKKSKSRRKKEERKKKKTDQQNTENDWVLKTTQVDPIIEPSAASPKLGRKSFSDEMPVLEDETILPGSSNSKLLAVEESPEANFELVLGTEENDLVEEVSIKQDVNSSEETEDINTRDEILEDRNTTEDDTAAVSTTVESDAGDSTPAREDEDEEEEVDEDDMRTMLLNQVASARCTTSPTVTTSCVPVKEEPAVVESVPSPPSTQITSSTIINEQPKKFIRLKPKEKSKGLGESEVSSTTNYSLPRYEYCYSRTFITHEEKMECFPNLYQRFIVPLDTNTSEDEEEEEQEEGGQYNIEKRVVGDLSQNNCTRKSRSSASPL